MSNNNSFTDANKQLHAAAFKCGVIDGTTGICAPWPLCEAFPDTAKTRYFSFVSKTFREMETLIQNKSHDYSVGDDPFVNFKTSEDLGVDKLVGLNVRLLDKVARIKSFSKSGNLKNEGIEDAYKDLIGYAVLALGMLEEDKHK